MIRENIKSSLLKKKGTKMNFNNKVITLEKKDENIQRACSSIMENYLPIFLPFNKLRKNNPLYKKFIDNGNILRIENKYGVLEIRNRLITQQHKDILETMLSNSKSYISEEQTMFVTIESRYDFLKQIGMCTTNYKYLEEKIKELEDISISSKYQTTNGKIIEEQFGIIAAIKMVEDITKSNHKKIIKVKFTKEFTAFYLDSNLLDYKKHINKIAELPTPFLKSIARYMLIHNKHQINISTFIENLGFDKIFTRNEINRKKKELEEYKECLKDLNIEVVSSKDKQSNTIKIDTDESKILIQNRDKKQRQFTF